MVRKFWLRRTDVTFTVNKKTGNLWVDGRELNDTAIKDLYKWLGRYLAYKKQTPTTVCIEELRIRARSIEGGLKDYIKVGVGVK